MSAYQVRSILRNLTLSPFDLVFIILRIIGFWPSDNWKTKWKLVYQYYTYFVISLCIIHFNGQLLYIIFNTVDIHSFLTTWMTFIPAFNSLVRAKDIVSKRTQITSLLKNTWDGLQNVRDNKEITIKKYYSKQFKFITVSICILYGTWLFTFVLIASLRYSDPIKLWIPHWLLVIVPYWFITTLSAMVLIILTAMIVVHDILLTGILMQLARHLDILNHRLATVPMSGNQRWRNLQFRECVRYHTHIYGMAKNIQDIFFAAIAVQLITISTILCTGVFELTTLESYSLDSIMLIFYTATIFVKAFSHCRLSNEITQKSTDISNAVYEMNWIGVDKSMSKDMTIMMIRSMMRPIVFTGILSIPMSMDTFRRILNTTYQAYTLLRQVQERHK